MSFGFSIGDFIAVIELAKRIRKEFVDAPEQFKDVSDEVRSLSIVLQDVEVVLSKPDLNIQQNMELREIVDGCTNILKKLEQTVDKYGELKPGSRSVGRRIKREWKKLKWEPEDIKELRSRLISHVSILNAFQGKITSQISLETKSGVDRLHQRQDYRDRRDEDQAILSWLTPTDYGTQQSDNLGQRQEGTGQWLLESAEFHKWIGMDQQTLFCLGIPGAGKTVLTSIVVQDLDNRFYDDKHIGIAYLYCDFRRQAEQKPDHLLASILKQLAARQLSLPESVKSLYKRHKTRHTRPSLDEVSQSLQSVITIYSRTFIVIDALDECQASHSCRTILEEVSRLQIEYNVSLFTTSRFMPEVTQNFQNSTRLEIRASEYDIRRYLDYHIFRLSSCVQQNPNLQEEIKGEIVNAVDGMFLLAQLQLESLVEKRSPKAVRAMLKELSSGSDAYDDAYRKVMARIEQQLSGDVELAKRALSWITCARRPLSIAELQHALAVEIGELKLDPENMTDITELITLCAGLVRVDEQSGTIRLVHYTTQQFFERTQEQWFPNAEAEISMTCAKYLFFDNFRVGICTTDEEFEERLQENPLYEYASRYWGTHAHKAPTVTEAHLGFLENNPKVEAALQSLIAVERYRSHPNYSHVVPKRVTGAHLAAHFGLTEILEELFLRGHNLDQEDSGLRTPLLWAADEGHDATVAFLLTRGVASDSKDELGRTPLSHASGNGHEAVVKILLGIGNLNQDSRDNFNQTPLSRASIFGHAAVVELLLARGDVNLDVEDENAQTPLSLAAMNGHEKAVKLLLATGRVQQSDSVDGKYGRTPLSWAAGRGCTAIMKQLLGTDGVNPESRSAGLEGMGRTPLSFAAEGGHQAAVELLTASGRVNPDVEDNHGRTPLSYAVAEAHSKTVQYLLDQNCNPTAVDVRQKGLLHYAIAEGNCGIEIVRTLLELNAPTDLIDYDNMTPLHYTVRYSQQDIAKLLIEKGVSVDINLDRKTWLPSVSGDRTIYKPRDRYEESNIANQCSPRGLTPLHYAALVGDRQMVKFFLDHGANPNATSYHGETPLHLALCKKVQGTQYSDYWLQRIYRVESSLDFIDLEDHCGYYETYARITKQRMAIIERLLEDSSINVNLKDVEGASLLHSAPYGEPECGSMVIKILEKGAEVLVANSKDQCPLQLACRAGDVESVKALLTYGANILHMDNEGLNALYYAARSRNLETLLYVLEASEKDSLNIAESRDKAGRNALHHALTQYPDMKLVELLMKRGVKVDGRDANGNSPLAFYFQNPLPLVDGNICRCLLQEGADPFARNVQGRTLVHLSARCYRNIIVVLEIFIELGVNITLPDIQGRTLLHHTALEGTLTETVLEFILSRTKLRLDDKDSHGKTPFDYATEEAGKRRHPHLFDSQRWSRCLKVLTTQTGSK